MRKFILTISLLGGLAPSAWCVPQVLNFQGRLLESGALVNGSRAMTFKIFDAAGGGNQLFVESRSVNVSTGVFNVLVGDATTGGVPLSVFDGGDRYIEVQVGTQTLPRQRVVSVGYSFRSDSASFATKAGSLLEATTTQPVIINVTQVNVTTISVTSLAASSATVSGSLRIGNHTIILGETPATGGVPNTIAFETGDAFIKTQDPSAGNLNLEAGANKNILLNGGGNVGVGVPSPETKMHVDGIVTSGRASITSGGLKLYNSASALATTIQAGNATTAVTYKLPPTDGVSGQALVTDGNGNLTWRTITIVNPPVISFLNPNNGPVGGGTVVTVSGNNFQNGVILKIDGIAATNVTYNNSAQFTATTPAGSAGAKDVTATNPDGQIATLPSGFTYTVVAPGCVGLIRQVFTPDSMVGCGSYPFIIPPEDGSGSITPYTYTQAEPLCNVAQGWHLCTLAEYNARRNGVIPNAQRWLAYPGSFSVYNTGFSPPSCNDQSTLRPVSRTTGGLHTCYVGLGCTGTGVSECSSRTPNSTDVYGATCCR